MKNGIYKSDNATYYVLNGNSLETIFDTKNEIFISPLGPFKLKIGKSKFIQKL